MIRTTEVLLARGHRIEDITCKYTMEQLNRFAVAARENMIAQRFEDTMAIRAAVQYGKEDFKKFAEFLLKRPKDAGGSRGGQMNDAMAAELAGLLSGKVIH